MGEFYGPLTGWGWAVCLPIAMLLVLQVVMLVVEFPWRKR